MRLWLGLICLTSLSCDKVLGLHEIHDATVITIDADLRPDAVDCATFPGGQPDEDADGRNDFCDNCPTVANVTQVDGDGDMVGIDCDSNPVNAGDRIAFFASMLSPEGLVLDLDATLENGTAQIRSSAIKVVPKQKPLKIVAEVSVRSFANNDKMVMEVDDGGGKQWSCTAGFGLPECGGSNCIYTRVPNGGAPQPIFFDEVAMTQRVVLETRANGFTQCTTTTQTDIAMSPAQMPPPVTEAQGTVAVKMQGHLEVRNVIVYDRP
jgi:hypothetical protein